MAKTERKSKRRVKAEYCILILVLRVDRDFELVCERLSLSQNTDRKS